MSDNRIFIGNIPHFVNQDRVKEKFEEHGTILHLFYFPDRLGSDRGWATITYQTIEEATMALVMENKVQAKIDSSIELETVDEDFEPPWPGAERPLHVKFCNQPLVDRKNTVFQPRPQGQKVLTPWKQVEGEAEEEGTEKQIYYV